MKKRVKKKTLVRGVQKSVKIKDENIEKNFKVYERGVAHLEELEKQLDKLDTRKFKKEEHKIREKLKYVSKIPEIEEDLRELKLKIAGVDVRSQKALVDRRQDKKLHELIENEKELMEKVYKIPFIENKAKFLTNSFIRGSDERAVEGEKLAHLRAKVEYLKKVIDTKAGELRRFVKSRTYSRMNDREKLSRELNELRTELDDTRFELSKKILKDSSETRWFMQKDRQEIQKEVSEALSRFKDKLEKEKRESKEINELEKVREFKEEVEKLKDNSSTKDSEFDIDKKISEAKNEVYHSMLDKIIQLRTELNKFKGEVSSKSPAELPKAEAVKDMPANSKILETKKGKKLKVEFISHENLPKPSTEKLFEPSYPPLYLFAPKKEESEIKKQISDSFESSAFSKKIKLPEKKEEYFIPKRKIGRGSLYVLPEDFYGLRSAVDDLKNHINLVDSQIESSLASKREENSILNNLRAEFNDIEELFKKTFSVIPGVVNLK